MRKGRGACLFNSSSIGVFGRRIGLGSGCLNSLCFARRRLGTGNCMLGLISKAAKMDGVCTCAASSVLGNGINSTGSTTVFGLMISGIRRTNNTGDLLSALFIASCGLETVFGGSVLTGRGSDLGFSSIKATRSFEFVSSTATRGCTVLSSAGRCMNVGIGASYMRLSRGTTCMGLRTISTPRCTSFTDTRGHLTCGGGTLTVGPLGFFTRVGSRNGPVAGAGCKTSGFDL